MRRLLRALSAKATDWFWHWGVKYIPTLRYGAFVRLTILLTLVATLFCEIILELTIEHLPPVRPHAMLIRVVAAAIVFLGVLLIQNLLIVAVFVRSFPRFIERLAGLHHVTRDFGIELLRRFFEGEFDPAILATANVASLPAVLQNLEAARGCPLPMPVYALLLQKSSEYRPVAVWATWDDEAFPIEQVFEPTTKRPKLPYDRYFTALQGIYERMPGANERTRVFIFKDEAKRDHARGSEAWKSIRELHLRWGFKKIWHCTGDTLEQARQSVGIRALDQIDDIVFFQDADNQSGWIVGMDRVDKSVVIRQEDVEIENVKEFFETLKRAAVEESLSPTTPVAVGAPTGNGGVPTPVIA